MFLIGSFEQKCLIIKGVLQSEKLKQHIFTIEIYQLLSNSALYEHTWSKNIKMLYKCSGGFYDRHNYKAIVEVYIVSAPEWLTKYSPMDVVKLINLNNPSTSKLLGQFSELLDVKQQTSVHILGNDKTNIK